MSCNLRYNEDEKERFKQFFTPALPPPKKRGRPKKKKRLRRTKKKKNDGSTKETAIEIANEDATARLEGAVAAAQLKPKRTRINWENPVFRARRERIANAWVLQNDIYEEGDTFRRFCERAAINEGVLRRYLIRKKDGIAAKKRGRKTLLPESVMRHICEGWLFNLFLFCVVLLLQLTII